MGFLGAGHSQFGSRLGRSFGSCIGFWVLFASLFAVAPAALAHEDDDGEGYEVAPPIYYPKPPAHQRRVEPEPQPVIKYKQPKLPGASSTPKNPIGPTMTYSYLRDSDYVFWSCSGTDVLRMRTQERSCVQDRKQGMFNPAFARHMDKHLYSCLADAAVAAGLPRPASVEVGNRSGLRPGDPRFHGRGRALDIGRVRLFDARGLPINTGIRSRAGNLAIRNGEIMMHENYYETDRTTQRYYDAFRSCWKRSLRGCDPIATIGCEASPGATAPRHHDHIHIQYPERCGF